MLVYRMTPCQNRFVGVMDSTNFCVEMIAVLLKYVNHKRTVSEYIGLLDKDLAINDLTETPVPNDLKPTAGTSTAIHRKTWVFNMLKYRWFHNKLCRADIQDGNRDQNPTVRENNTCSGHNFRFTFLVNMSKYVRTDTFRFFKIMSMVEEISYPCPWKMGRNSILDNRI